MRRLGSDLCDQLVIIVVVQDGDTFSFGYCRDQQIGQADRSDAPAAPQGALDVKRAPPVLIMAALASALRTDPTNRSCPGPPATQGPPRGSGR